MVGKDTNRGCGHCGCGNNKSNQFNEEQDEVDHDISTGYLKSDAFKSSKSPFIKMADEDEDEDSDDEDYDDEDDSDEDFDEDEDEDSDDDSEDEDTENKKKGYSPRKP